MMPGRVCLALDISEQIGVILICVPARVAFYKRGVSRKNFSHASGMKGYLDRQLPLSVSMPTRLYLACLPRRHRLSITVPTVGLPCGPPFSLPCLFFATLT